MAAKQGFVGIRLSNKQRWESVIELASTVREAKRIAEDIKGKWQKSCSPAYLKDKVYSASLNLTHWEVFIAWLKREYWVA